MDILNKIKQTWADIDKKLQNKAWRLNHLYHIQNLDGEDTVFKMNFFQRMLFLNLHFRNIILKARQLGISTFIALFFLDAIVFSPDKTAVIVADKEDNAKKIFDKVLFAWDSFPSSLKKYLKIDEKTRSKTELVLSNGSKIVVGTTIHGGTYHYLHISELGVLCAESPDKAEKIIKSALPAAPKSAIVFIESTAEGENNLFHDLWEQGITDYDRSIQVKQQLSQLQLRPHFFPWWQYKEYTDPIDQDITPDFQKLFNDYFTDHGIELTKEQKNWYIVMSKLQKTRMKEQYPTFPDEAFRISGNKLFDPEVIREMTKHVCMPMSVHAITLDEKYRGELLIWKTFMRGHRYAIGGDVAEGVERDSSTICIIDFTTYEVVATYKNNEIDPEDFAHVLAYVGRMYGCPLIAPEWNNNGQVTCKTLYKIYPSVHKQVIESEAEQKRTNRLGFYTKSAAVKADIMWGLHYATVTNEHPKLKIYDQVVLNEMKSYSKNDNLIVSSNQKVGSTRHFDMLMATAICWKMNAFANISVTDENDEERTADHRHRAMRGENNFD
jgi:hypothetical protein